MEPETLLENYQEEEKKDLEYGNGNGHTNGLPSVALAKEGLTWHRLFGEGDPYDAITWDRRDARITKGGGEIVFEQKDIEVPSFWSQTATDIVASKYFRGRLDSPNREWSAKQLIDRVANTISGWGLKDGYFASHEDYENFRQDLKFILINQFAAFNSPVWFNVGIYEKPQCSACFILSVKDDIHSILDWYKNEGMIFRGGSGSGINLSTLRSSKEPLSKGGYSSGPVSFMKGADGVANSIRSGGTTRRAAKMVILNSDHPDIKDFIYSKRIIEEMTKTLQASGVQNSLETNMFDPYTLLPYQNANNSVRVTDEFMNAVLEDKDWHLKAVTSGEVLETVKAREILDWCAESAWHSADPGMQYDTTINDWHTCSNTGRINASNPCSEYMHLDDSACNLASLNLLKFLKEDGSFDVDFFKKAVDTMILAQDIIVDNSSYPTEKITQNVKDYRELGLGYANLGALLMVHGLPYDSDSGRAIGGTITSLMCGEAYKMSVIIAKIKGPFAGYELNKEPMLRVLAKHTSAGDALAEDTLARNLYQDEHLRTESQQVWHDALELAQVQGVRNSQVTVLAPTGTIAFLMDCDTTGVEPELALIKYKKLVGGGMLKLVNNQVNIALERLGYSETEIQSIKDYLLENETIEGAPHLKQEHLPVFDCSFKATKGSRTISYMGHLKMMGAVQPFVSGAISKTVNLPNEATVEDVRNAFIEAWKSGIKAVAFYRDGSKTIQPLNTKKDDKLVEKVNGYTRVKLPDERPSITHKFSVGSHEGYITTGLYPNTMQPGETFITIAREGSTVSGLMGTIATLISLCLQSGVPLKSLVKKFKDVKFEPAGFTSNEEIPTAKSIVDYIFRYLGKKFLSKDEQEEIFGPANPQIQIDYESPKAELVKFPAEGGHASGGPKIETDAMVCTCGALMFKVGSCYSCPNCFATTGVCN